MQSSTGGGPEVINTCMRVLLAHNLERIKLNKNKLTPNKYKNKANVPHCTGKSNMTFHSIFIVVETRGKPWKMTQAKLVWCSRVVWHDNK